MDSLILNELFDSDPLSYEVVKDEVSNKVITFEDERKHLYKLWVYKKSKYGKDVWVALLSEKAAQAKSYKRILGKFKDPKTIISTLIVIFKQLKSDYGTKIKGLLFELPEKAFGSYSMFVKKVLTRELRTYFTIPNVEFTDSEIQDMDLLAIPMVSKPYTYKTIFIHGNEQFSNKQGQPVDTLSNNQDIPIKKDNDFDVQNTHDQLPKYNTKFDLKLTAGSKTLTNKPKNDLDSLSTKDKIEYFKKLASQAKETPEKLDTSIDKVMSKKEKQKSILKVDVKDLGLNKDLYSYNSESKDFLINEIKNSNIQFTVINNEAVKSLKERAIVGYIYKTYHLNSKSESELITQCLKDVIDVSKGNYVDESNNPISIYKELNEIDTVILNIVLQINKIKVKTFTNYLDANVNSIQTAISMGNVFKNASNETKDSIISQLINAKGQNISESYDTVLSAYYQYKNNELFDYIQNDNKVSSINNIYLQEILTDSNTITSPVNSLIKILYNVFNDYDNQALIAKSVQTSPLTSEKIEMLSLKKSPINNIIDKFTELAKLIGYDQDEFALKLNKMLPAALVNPLFSPDKEIFELGFFEAWVDQVNSKAHHCGFVGTTKYKSNDNGLNYYKGQFEDVTDYYSTLFESNDYTNQFDYVYNKTQNLFANVHGSDDIITLYRGIDVDWNSFEMYTPAPLESWSTKTSVALTFSKRSKYVLQANIPKSAIFAFYKNFENFEKCQKYITEFEYIILGGALKDVELNIVKYESQEEDPQVQRSIRTFEEFEELSKKVSYESKQIKVVTYDKTSFDKLKDQNKLIAGADVKTAKHNKD